MRQFLPGKLGANTCEKEILHNDRGAAIPTWKAWSQINVRRKDYATVTLRQFLPGKLGANTGEKDPAQNEIPGLHP